MQRMNGSMFFPNTAFMSHYLLLLIVLLIALLQYRLWWGDGGVMQNREYQQRIAQLNEELKKKQDRNQSLYAEVLDLRQAREAIEERARHDLGMIRDDETFFEIIQ